MNVILQNASRGYLSTFAAIIIACFGVYLIGNGQVALWDRDEPRFAQTSRQMLQSGDWVVPRFLDTVRSKKPPLIYWCQAIAMKWLGDDAFAARLPSAVAMFLLLIVLAVVLTRCLGPQHALWTVFIFGTSGLTIAAAKMCITDAVLMLFVTIAQMCFYAVFVGKRSWAVFIIWGVALGFAALTKGPVILGMQLTTLIVLGLMRLLPRSKLPGEEPGPSAYLRSRRDGFQLLLKLTVALAIGVMMFLPWWILVNQRAAEFRGAVTREVWDRMMTPLEQHSGPPGYYFVSIWGTFFPWSLFLPLAIGLGIKHRARPLLRFCVAAVVGPWIMLECFRTKLPHYLLPAFAPLAILTADALVRSLRREQDDWRSKFFVGVVGVWAVVISLVGLAPWLAVFVKEFRPLPYRAMVTLSVVSIMYAVAVHRRFKDRDLARAASTMGFGMAALVLILYGMYLPNAGFLRLSPRLANDLIAEGATHKNDAIMMGYMEPSLAFHQGGTLREAGEIVLAQRSAGEFTPWMVVSRERWDAAPDDIKAIFDVVRREVGWAYADKGKVMEVVVLKKKMTNDQVPNPNQ